MRIRFQACYRHLNTASLLLPLVLAGCGGVPLTGEPVPEQARATPTRKSSPLPALPPAGSGRGGYYKDDGPGDAPPEGLLDTPDAEPRVEPYASRGNKPYVVFGKSYTPITDERPFKQRGVGSWYGRKFHGQKTSSGEIYDMYKMTAAHPTLPIPSYVRVTNVANGKQVIVRVNDRGPFHSGRIIDLSYTAALKLGYLGKGSSELEVERLLPEQIAQINAERGQIALKQPESAPAPASAGQPVEVIAVAAGSVTSGIETRPLPLAQIIPAAQPLPAAAQPASPSASASAMPAATPGFYVQLGAYSRQANAEAARARHQEARPSGVPAVEVIESGGLFRLAAGPYASRAEAAAAAAQLQSGSAGRPVITQR
ncbi:MAG TPA: septal ring lytic transglycosylase RlpA family protein [Noviherbaspirillum sp.]|jgi:rare lipoprotein A|uniref:septal ring lytic transglycosylase RlpA family protein n=1 Tax=Noviherbaspirillum sp. TaxID=1926288 RepID=UPI002F94B65C